MFWLGFLLSLGLGASFGVWALQTADRLRCRSVGFPSAQEALVCPRVLVDDAWWMIPWERLRAGANEGAQARLCATIGAGVWAWAWVFLWNVDSRIELWAWHVVLLSWLLLLAILDARWRVLPIEPMLAAGVAGFLLRWLVFGDSLESLLQGGVTLLLFFGLQTWLSRGRWLASGDPVLAASIGLMVGWPLAGMTVYFTYLAVIPLLIWQWWRTRTIRRVRWPFAPLLFIGTWLSLGWGERVWQWMVGA